MSSVVDIWRLAVASIFKNNKKITNTFININSNNKRLVIIDIHMS